MQWIYVCINLYRMKYAMLKIVEAFGNISCQNGVLIQHSTVLSRMLTETIYRPSIGSYRLRDENWKTFIERTTICYICTWIVSVSGACFNALLGCTQSPIHFWPWMVFKWQMIYVLHLLNVWYLTNHVLLIKFYFACIFIRQFLNSKVWESREEKNRVDPNKRWVRNINFICIGDKSHVH